ncbi:putative U11/U12 small nuclear ribonucleoprotein 25 kDa protein [Melia azedarach]|uniref:U11/U12 small nuclear ribonucleoprotein 25 kDa protein n=1 Tax=Melia azedarach TaxID=155640 RepID=A0ACC1Y5K7_MELAZ|nr:putative U11/U12 small nuclear ribonucleoprotein 25 kDa protein [Melia azedarach]
MVRVLIERRCVAPLTLNDDDDLGDYEGSLRKLSYLKLPQTRLKLSVLKLDGSLFDIYIDRNASVADLKQAIEEVFILSPREDQGTISWMHVWGHFCLCYDGQKLVNDKVHVRDLKIKDGDQLQFIRHMSLDYLHSKRRSKIRRGACQQNSMSSLGLDVREYNKHDVLPGKDNLEDQDVSSSSATEATTNGGLANKDTLGNQDDSQKYYQQ